jgi:hypothetical protein
MVLPVCSAVWTKSGPKKLPPIPIATTSVNGFPVTPTWWEIQAVNKSKLRRTELTQQTSHHMCLPKCHFAHDLWNPLSCQGLPTHLEPHSCHHKKSAHIVELAEPHARRHDLQSYWSAHTTKTATWSTKDKLQFQNIIDCTTRQRGPFITL